MSDRNRMRKRNAYPAIRKIRYWFGPGSCGRAVSSLLLAGMFAAMLAPAGASWAQSADDAAKSKAAAQAAAHAKALAEARDKVFSELSRQVRELRQKEAAIADRRESAARQELQKQQHLLNQAQARLQSAKSRSDVLDRRWAKNAARVAKLQKSLTQHQGNLGELYGVVRQIAANASSVMKNSLITTQLEPAPGQTPRSMFLTKLAKGHAVPSVNDFQRLWYELLRGIVASGKVVRYQADVLQLENGKPTGKSKRTEVVRVGPFTAVNGNEYLGYLSSAKSLTELKGALPGNFRTTAYNLTHAAPGSGYTSGVVDPAAGGILGRYLTRPSWFARIQLGEAVGYVIIALGLIALLLAVVQFIYLILTNRAINAQLKDLSRPKDNNPIGRLLTNFQGRKLTNAKVAESRLSEAVQLELPALERFQSFIRLVVAAGPLLGLIGTVTGMIITFHAIVASGSSDPTVMATGIGQAMIATVLGLGVAVPLLFIVTGLSAFSGRLIKTLEEFSHSLLAEKLGADNENTR
ncbi:MAG: MotA/TolQ/ExbB proton channel family protein [Gammaproteobacteria bacterium]|nr:MotA/TolQ/ExbB proton channel family protein [Gammaproteobacteria bacterium]